MFSLPATVTLEAGYDCAFANITGVTVVEGSMTISGGRMTISRGTLALQ